MSSDAESHGALAERRIGRKLPVDFEAMCEFATEVLPEDPTEALAALDLRLVGPFDFALRADASGVNTATHMRFCHDPPEFFTVMQRISVPSWHIGCARRPSGPLPLTAPWPPHRTARSYVHDVPNDVPSLLAHNDPSAGPAFGSAGDNVFAAVVRFTRGLLTTSPRASRGGGRGGRGGGVGAGKRRAGAGSDTEGAPVVYTRGCGREAGLLLDRLRVFAAKRGIEVGDGADKAWRMRQKAVVGSTISRLGLVVPVDATTEVGYRPLCETRTAIEALFRRLDGDDTRQRRADWDRLDEITNWTVIANDECDFGMGLHWGLELWAGPLSVTDVAARVLRMAYSLLGRAAFGDVVAAMTREVRERAPRAVDELGRGGGAGTAAASATGTSEEPAAKRRRGEES